MSIFMSSRSHEVLVPLKAQVDLSLLRMTLPGGRKMKIGSSGSVRFLKEQRQRCLLCVRTQSWRQLLEVRKYGSDGKKL